MICRTISLIERTVADTRTSPNCWIPAVACLGLQKARAWRLSKDIVDASIFESFFSYRRIGKVLSFFGNHKLRLLPASPSTMALVLNPNPVSNTTAMTTLDHYHPLQQHDVQNNNKMNVFFRFIDGKVRAVSMRFVTSSFESIHPSS
jgi:hypothetical protein